MQVFELRAIPQTVVDGLENQIFEYRMIPVSLKGRLVFLEEEQVVWGNYVVLPDPEKIPGIQRISKIEKIPGVRSTTDFVRKVYL